MALQFVPEKFEEPCFGKSGMSGRTACNQIAIHGVVAQTGLENRMEKSAEVTLLTPGSRISIRILAILACVAALYFGKDFFVPVLLSIIVALTLSPIVQWASRLGIPSAISSVIVIAALLAGVATAMTTIATPLSGMVADAPRIGQELKWKLRNWREPMEKISQAETEMGKLTSGDTRAPAQEVVVRQPGMLSRAADDILGILATIVLTIALTFFLLTSREMILIKVVQISPRLSDKKRALAIIREIELDVSRYLLTITAINTCLGIVIGTGFYLLGMPNPLLWGILAAGLNFLPYLGSGIGIVVATALAIVAFPTIPQTLTIPAFYIAVTTLEGQFITPYILGRRFELNTVVVLVFLIFWGVLWGAVGVFAAMPILIILNAISQRIESLSSLGHFLSAYRQPVPEET